MRSEKKRKKKKIYSQRNRCGKQGGWKKIKIGVGVPTLSPPTLCALVGVGVPALVEHGSWEEE